MRNKWCHCCQVFGSAQCPKILKEVQVGVQLNYASGIK